MLVGLFAFLAAPAFGAKTHRFVTSFGQAALTGSVGGIAVDEAAGNVLVVDGQLVGSRVAIFGSEGGPANGVAPPEIGGLAAPIGIAVDNSATSPSKGAVYVSDSASGAIKKFVLEGGKYELKGELKATPSLGPVFSIAVDSKGNVFVGDNNAEAVVEFSPAGVQIARLDVSAIGSPPDRPGSPNRVAVDSLGDLFVQSSSAVYRFDANGSGEIEGGTKPVQIVEPGHAYGIAVDSVTDALYVSFNGASDEPHVEEYSATCTPEGVAKNEHCVSEGEFGRGAFVNALSLAINSNTGFVYVADPKTGPDHPTSNIAAFGPPVIVPGSVTGQATGVTGISASLNGTVNPSGLEVRECSFEWGPTLAYGNTVPCTESPVDIGSGSTPKPVHADINGLGLGTEYHFRLLATNDFTGPDEIGPPVGADKSFTTLGPQVRGESASRVSDTTAKLEALVNPNKEATSYVFEYVSEADFGASEWAKAISVPPGGKEIGSGNANVAIAEQVDGLSPFTTYHFRAAAINASGTAYGPDQTFMTYAQAGVAGLPDGRVFEQVTPVDKNGSAPVRNASRIQAARSGDGLIYISHGGIPGGEGAQRFPIYLAARGSNWSTQGLLPPQSAGSAAGVLGWSEDLSRAYVVQADPGVPASLFERNSATHSLRLIAAEGSDVGTFYFVGASATGSAVFFESNTLLPPGGAAKAPNLYVWDKASDELSLAGVLNSRLAPAKGTFAGSNEPGFREHYLQDQHTLSNDGSRVFFTDIESGQLYMRENPTQAQSELDGAGKCIEADMACTVQVSAPQRTVLDPKGKKSVVFWGATPDGSKSFFTSPGKLTDDATTGPNDEGNDLYRYDAETGELVDLVPDAGDAKGADVRGILGTSEDGAYVYFAANGVLTSTPNPLGQSAAPGDCSTISYSTGGSGACNLYLSHDGAVTFIARLAQSAEYPKSDAANWWFTSIGTARAAENTARVSPNGQTLLFRSQRKITDYDNEGFPEFYRYSAPDDGLECVSCNPTGAAPRGPATLQSLGTSQDLGPLSASVLTRSLSAGGERVFFETPDKLVASDINGDASCPFSNGSGPVCQDVYEWEAEGTGSCRSAHQNGGCLYLISTGESTEASFFADADEEGNNAFFYTEQSLVGQDTDQIVDIYDARIGGGISSQSPPPPPPACEGEACKGPVPAPPPSESPGSASFSGPADKKPSRQNKKQHKKKKKKQHHKRPTSKKHG